MQANLTCQVQEGKVLNFQFLNNQGWILMTLQ